MCVHFELYYPIKHAFRYANFRSKFYRVDDCTDLQYKRFFKWIDRNKLYSIHRTKLNQNLCYLWNY